MHLIIIIIALGVFAGLWLFVRWGEWREARWERREIRRMEREVRRAERERAQAQLAAEPPPLARPWRAFGLAIVVVCAIITLVGIMSPVPAPVPFSPSVQHGMSVLVPH